MGSIAQKSALIICGDYMEDYEIIVPFFTLQSLGIRVDCASPGKRSGDKCFTAVHDYLGFELYTELQGHFFKLNANFDQVKMESYDVVIIPGGRSTEFLSADEKLVNQIKQFAETGKPLVTSCHSQLLLVAAGLVQGKKITSFQSLKPIIELAGGIWWEERGVKSVLEITSCLKDGNLISSIGWPAHGEYIRVVLESMGAKIFTSRKSSVLIFIADYVEDYEVNVPFRALQGLGVRVDVVCPSKKKGESCVTAIQDDEGAQIFSEKRGHNFAVNANWSEICGDEYDCLVLPGGRSPELLVMNEKVVSLVKEFAHKDKIIAAIGHGKWLLAAAGALQGKKCASSDEMKAIVKMGGAEVVESHGCVIDGKLLTTSGWPSLPAFLTQLICVLGLSVVF